MSNNRNIGGATMKLMTCTRREPWNWVDDLMRGVDLFPALAGEPISQAVFSPRIDVAETETALTVSAELPGLDEKDVTVELEDEVLTISGEKKAESETTEKGWYRAERHYGSFRRVIPLPTDVQADAAKAVFKRGVLSIDIPKKPEAVQKKHTLKIQAA
jgi:HSP20 family protein